MIWCGVPNLGPVWLITNRCSRSTIPAKPAGFNVWAGVIDNRPGGNDRFSSSTRTYLLILPVFVGVGAKRFAWIVPSVEGDYILLQPDLGWHVAVGKNGADINSGVSETPNDLLEQSMQ